MLAIGRALLLNPKLLILDEPSQGLAPLIVREVFRIVAKMRDEGISVLLVEQNARMSLAIADNAFVLDHGNIVYAGSAKELAADEERVQALAGASAEKWHDSEGAATQR
jgi:branched-chain amino acid transport system ATP-binding protein